ncbi:MAG: hypothetical protein Q7R73_05285 [bacterium]|nr:hypothetical protein [bacterium]
MITKSTLRGFLGMAALLALYFAVVSFISGWPFALNQFSQFWYFIVSLSAGFGIQIGLYSYLRGAIRERASGGIIAVSGTTSTIAMVSCCAHYLANLIPLIGVSGAVALIGQYQIELFWFGLLANAIGIGYIISRIIKFLKQ